MPRDEDKTAGDRSKAFLVDSIDHFQTTGRVVLQQRGCDVLDVFQLLNFVADFDRHGGSAQAQDKSRAGRLQHDVGANAFDALGRFGEDSGSEADDENDQGDFDGDGDDADQSANRPMQEVAENQFAHHGWGSLAGCLESAAAVTRTNSELAGCASWNRSAGNSALNSIFMTCRSRR